MDGGKRLSWENLRSYTRSPVEPRRLETTHKRHEPVRDWGKDEWYNAWGEKNTTAQEEDMQDSLACGSALSDDLWVCSWSLTWQFLMCVSLGGLLSVSRTRVWESEDGLSTLAVSPPHCTSASSSECLSFGAGERIQWGTMVETLGIMVGRGPMLNTCESLLFWRLYRGGVNSWEN